MEFTQCRSSAVCEHIVSIIAKIDVERSISLGVSNPSPLKTCPRCPPQAAQVISVRVMNSDLSSCLFTAPGIAIEQQQQSKCVSYGHRNTSTYRRRMQAIHIRCWISSCLHTRVHRKQRKYRHHPRRICPACPFEAPPCPFAGWLETKSSYMSAAALSWLFLHTTVDRHLPAEGLRWLSIRCLPSCCYREVPQLEWHCLTFLWLLWGWPMHLLIWECWMGD